MEKQDAINPLFDLPDSSELLAQFHNLIFQKKFAEAISFAKHKLKNCTTSYTYYTGLSICYSQTSKPKEALKILAKAVILFPENADVYYYLGSTHFDLDNYEEAEECFLKSLELSPANKKIERSECLNNLGVLYWNDLRREEALDCWNGAAKENPFNSKAQENIKEYSNDFGEPKAANRLFDDLYHFQNIHKKKYLELKAKTDFDNIGEAEQWMEFTTKKWNELMEAKLHDIDSMTPVQKTELFNSVTIDYSIIDKKNKSKQLNRNSKKSSANKSKSFRKGFSFLDQDLLLLLPLTVPILSIFGLEKDRFEDIANGSKATDEEEELFFWAFDFLEAVLESVADIPSVTKKQLIFKAKQIALEFLDEQDADEAIDMTIELCNDLFGGLSKLKLNKRLR